MTAATATALENRVVDALRAAGHGGEPTALEPLLGGHSGLTYKIALGDERFVVKAVPPGQRSIGRHDMLRQARIMSRRSPTPTSRCRRCRATDDGRAGLVRDGAGAPVSPSSRCSTTPRSSRRWPRRGCVAPPRCCRACTPYRCRRCRSTASRSRRPTSWPAGSAPWPPSRPSWPPEPRAAEAAGGLRPRRRRPGPGPRRLPARQHPLRRLASRPR